MAQDALLRVVAGELLLDEQQVEELLEAAFPEQLNVAAADLIAAGAHALEPAFLRGQPQPENPEGAQGHRGFWSRRSSR